MNHLTKMQPNSRRICSEQCGFVEGTAALRFPRQDPSSAAKLLCASQEPEREQGNPQGSQRGVPEESPAGIPGTRRQGRRMEEPPSAQKPVVDLTKYQRHRLHHPPLAWTDPP